MTPGPGDGPFSITVPRLDRSPEAIQRARFYRSRAWKGVRAIQLAREPLCQRCLRDHRRAVPAAAVHHVLSIEERPDLALVVSNLESICKACHSAHHAKRLRQVIV